MANHLGEQLDGINGGWHYMTGEEGERGMSVIDGDGLKDKYGNCLHLHYDSLACYCHDCHEVKEHWEVISVEEARKAAV